MQLTAQMLDRLPLELVPDVFEMAAYAQAMESFEDDDRKPETLASAGLRLCTLGRRYQDAAEKLIYHTLRELDGRQATGVVEAVKARPERGFLIEWIRMDSLLLDGAFDPKQFEPRYVDSSADIC